MAATRSQVVRLIEKIPVDHLRPHANFQQNLMKRLDTFSARDVSALEAIAADKFKVENPLSNNVMRPSFNPNYYEKLMASLRGSQTSSSPFHFITKYFRWK